MGDEIDAVDDILTDDEPPLADRASRFFAFLIDAISILIPCGIAVATFSSMRGIEPDGFIQDGKGEKLLYAAATIAIWVLLNFVFLKRGQTIGKRVMKIQVVDFETGAIPTLTTLVLLRYGLFQFISQTGLIGFAIAVADPLMIFGEDKRCVHDYLARTKVIDVRKNKG